MTNQLCAFILCFSILNVSCNNANDNALIADNSDSTSTERKHAEKQNDVPSVEPPNSEINDYSTLRRKDFIPIVYRSERDTIYGFRKGDTLYTDGDIKIVYPSTGTKSVGTTSGLWQHSPTRIVIPYKIAYSNPDKVRRAIGMWQAGLPHIRFVEQTFEDDYILFVNSKYNQSFVGKIGGVQTIELTSNALEGNVAHEIGHALGLYHEHTRSDRDRYITVLKTCQNNVNYRHAFKKDPYAIDIGGYNYNSIMHYPPTECLTFPSTLPENANPGQRLRVTNGDFTGIKKIYRLQ